MARGMPTDRNVTRVTCAISGTLSPCHDAASHATSLPAARMPRTPLIPVELDPPYRVGTEPARYQSVWLLARLWLAHRRDGAALPAAAIRARFADAADVRMMVSRAFADFARWGVTAGWGHDPDADPATLSRARRSRGPFWLPEACARRLRFRVGGRGTDLAGVARWLGEHASVAHLGAPALATDGGLAHAMRDMAFWRQMTQAMRLAQDGFAGSGDSSVAESFRAAQRHAGDDFQHALSLLKESLAWRRSDRLDRCRAALRRFDRIASGMRDTLPTFAAMACIVRAWERYARGETEAALAMLGQLDAEADLRPVVRFNPRVRFEALNLEALLRKSEALRPGTTMHGPASSPATTTTTTTTAAPAGDARAQAAGRALTAFAGALQSAYEADSVDAVQHAAANIGWSLWLFWQHRLVDSARTLAAGDIQRQAMRWLGLSEWICDRFGVGGGSAWNTIFLLRIARGECASAPQVSLAAFRAQRPLTVAAAIDALRPFHAPFAPAKGFTRWSSVAAFALEEHDAGHVRYNALQLANLLLESVWYLAHEQGASPAAGHAMARLTAQLPKLRTDERGFFLANIATLPAELAGRV